MVSLASDTVRPESFPYATGYALRPKEVAGLSIYHFDNWAELYPHQEQLRNNGRAAVVIEDGINNRDVEIGGLLVIKGGENRGYVRAKAIMDLRQTTGQMTTPTSHDGMEGMERFLEAYMTTNFLIPPGELRRSGDLEAIIEAVGLPEQMIQHVA